MRKRLYRAGLAWLMAGGEAPLLRWLDVEGAHTPPAVLTPLDARPLAGGQAPLWAVLPAPLPPRLMDADGS